MLVVLGLCVRDQCDFFFFFFFCFCLCVCVWILFICRLNYCAEFVIKTDVCVCVLNLFVKDQYIAYICQDQCVGFVKDLLHVGSVC